MALETVRCEVFVKEQGVPRNLELDGRDANSLHWLAFTPEEEPVGTKLSLNLDTITAIRTLAGCGRYLCHVMLSVNRFGPDPAGRFAVMARWHVDLNDLLTKEQRKQIAGHLIPSFGFTEEVRV